MIDALSSSVPDLHLAAVIEHHFDPQWGSPYWLSKKGEFDFDPVTEIQTFEDLSRFGPFPEEDLRKFPASHFVPRKYHNRIPEFVYSETGGTTGKAKGVYFSPSEFRDGFVEPFLRVCFKVGWPQGEKWLFLGPTGPHIIGKVLDPICRKMGSPPPFRIDFDPRWSLKLTDRSAAKVRYLEHVVDQAVHLIEKERPRILFGSPRVLQRLAERTTESSRAEILAVHYGGTSLDPELYHRFSDEWFPNAIHLSGYGNSLVGVAFEAGVGEQDRLKYYPSANRHRIRLIPLEDGPIEGRLQKEVEDGQTGQVVVTRLDSTFFIPNLIERDQAEKVSAPDSVSDLGWSPQGIRNPRPITIETTIQRALY
jgi:phenylacetate-coenzyme A ligase PaaK-like adenylate-forming protein